MGGQNGQVFFHQNDIGPRSTKMKVSSTIEIFRRKWAVKLYEFTVKLSPVAGKTATFIKLF